MKEKDTDKLLHSLKKAEDFKTALSETKPYAINPEVSTYLNEWLLRKQLTKGKVLKRAEITETTGYQYFDGKRNPPREKLIALAIGLELTLDEMNNLLKKSGVAQLYPKHQWDAVVIYGIIQQLSIAEIDELLYEENLKTFL
ncbi:helix-turn-helix transcriptional regulator [Enterococcus sp. BWM-S5]|uniref:Helix-turn-helix transcriptional regulator n=1 Tax=Enterococcus larvae TaxID=2794352 RepID=A0ABS4CFA6_9ENTE|nr:helix-turn-helix transcriptional regulator [Enterococcus larvae]MBP1044903.1 helix-turn-helix transcriptional regulator [Enterococcus larvae]